MLSSSKDHSGPASSPSFAPVQFIQGDIERGLLLICDHASNALPEHYHALGLPATEFQRHIAYDIGAAALTRSLAVTLGVPAVLSCFSRLLIDPNRGEDDPTLIMQLSDGAVVPGNRRIDERERQHRLNTYYHPYHDAVAASLDAAEKAGYVPGIISIHSYTARWKEVARPWHAGILWDSDPRLPVPLMEALRQDDALMVGDNEPYSGALRNDTMYKHGTMRGIAHALLEVRQDLIADEAGVKNWCDRLAPIFEDLMHLESLRKIRYFDSSAD